MPTITTSVPRWLEVARKYEGVREVKGPRANPIVLGWLQNEGKGKSWVKDDATPWCGGFQAGVFSEAGLAAIIPAEPLRAKSWASVGVSLNGPRLGAIYVRKRPGGHHVALVERWNATHVWVLGGNQDDSVNVSCFARDEDDVYRWPVPLKTPREVAAAGSRIAQAAARQQRDTVVSGGSGLGSPLVTPDPAPHLYGPPAPSLADQVQALPEQLGTVKHIAATANEVAAYLGIACGWVLFAASVYFAARVMWDGYRIRAFRTQDANEGWDGVET